MIVSMTGYGRGKAEDGDTKVTVEMKTVNHRFCEFIIRMPRQLMILEEKVKKKASQYIRRGRAELFITVEGEGLVTKKLQLDWSLTEQFFSHMETVQTKYDLAGPSLHDMLQVENILFVEEENNENKELEGILFSALTEALESLKKMRNQEGLELMNDLSVQAAKIHKSITIIKEYAPEVALHYREKLVQRLAEFAEGAGDESRLLTEAAILADKADVNEELTRLESHLLQFSDTLEVDEPVGRKLDFLVQEMNREVNTIGSKANDSRMTREVVEMKSLLEKMKEQVQNIE
ncbi:YicC family protein [Peribacillus psychrosaccharolyticus]|uniref:YicC family protein n=1 Tax=Peribacillus psychrosaccharolyticus TaxID=1407 RepID=A0A974S1F4_PERPY|nr:YicC/YloC family endoribonuclease [Peribacillus psychrosaccharolyticus]MEC2053728.1 YicC family protein [Peribacillus psychrosaccharolyticus]MED3742657.1 YicC family protein [Peribacillus psychrosaccharolyticus]QQT01602.1 YicC family protein [Peribacillus psychrosaccharolyticus]